MKISNSMRTGLFAWVVTLGFVLTSAALSLAQIGIWTSAEELANKPMSGPAWDAVKKAADDANPDGANVSDQDSNNNAEILAVGIVYARTGDERYKNKVIAACEKLVAVGHPGGRTLAWARETGAYAMAADLVGYRTAAFETWLRNMAEGYKGSQLNKTLREMFEYRPNNWGSHAFGSLCAVYRYLGDTTALSEIRDYWIQGVIGPNPGYKYGSDKSWHVDPSNPRLINPKGAIKQNMNIDGIIPDDMRRGASFSNPPKHTGYPWEFMQGQIMAARVLERAGLPIWDVADSAIYRAVYALQVRLENNYGGWKAEGDDLWMLPFLDKAYGTNWSEGQPLRMWKHGKNTGWPYVVWDGTVGVKESNGAVAPRRYELLQNYPNPFNPGTSIRYCLAQSGPMKLLIYDIIGRTVSTLVDGFQRAGTYTQEWEAMDSDGQELPCGIYLCRMQAGSYVKTMKMILVR